MTTIHPVRLSRRAALKTTLLAAAAAGAGAFDLSAASVHWPVGCFNRPWMQKPGDTPQPLTTPQPTNWGFDVALQGMKQAGFKMIGLLTRAAGEPFIAAHATDEYIATLKQKISVSGLVATMAALSAKVDGSVEDGIKDVRTQIDHAQTLGLQYLLTFGVDDQAQYETYCKVMADAADYAQERSLKLVIKPHGGSSGASSEILDCLKKVGRPNFKIWYDAGNIIYYTGKDPLEELKPIINHVTGFCAKDCAAPKGDVFIQLGRGKVNFHAVFAALRDAGFVGPVFLECAGGKKAEQVTMAVQRNREFLEQTFAAL
ncbi:MAG TPA: sugar phosphate isomerase/epimerase family protein [Verrucomicrobiae bacterium]|nr:sugar phosphate isomerase/epimerase family protein [Verrucomicrobiae bacterium]